jgi:hypothetical protein
MCQLALDVRESWSVSSIDDALPRFVPPKVARSAIRPIIVDHNSILDGSVTFFLDIAD